MASIQLELPDEVLISLKQSPDELAKEVRLVAAMKLYEPGNYHPVGRPG